jgi:chorismate mutase
MRPANSSLPSLDELRKQIDAVDEQIVRLLNERAKVVAQTA